jgi:hypothetical protein
MSSKKKIKFPLRGRYGISATVRLQKANKWVFRSQTGFIRFGATEWDPNKVDYIDFDGGPIVALGDNIGDLHPLLPDEIVTHIEFIKGTGLCVFTKNKHEDTVPTPAEST